MHFKELQYMSMPAGGANRKERERKRAKQKKTDPITDLGRESEFLRLESLAVCFTNAFLVIEYATWLH